MGAPLPLDPLYPVDSRWCGWVHTVRTWHLAGAGGWQVAAYRLKRRGEGLASARSNRSPNLTSNGTDARVFALWPVGANPETVGVAVKKNVRVPGGADLPGPLKNVVRAQRRP